MQFLKQLVVMGMASGTFNEATWDQESLTPDDLLASLTIAVRPDIELPDSYHSMFCYPLETKHYIRERRHVAYTGLKFGALCCVYRAKLQPDVVI